MKKVLLSTISALTIATTSLNAGAIVDIEVGAGSWMAETSGGFKYKGGDSFDMKDTLGIDDSTNTYFYADFNHFVPLIPNLRLENQALTQDATKQISNLNFGSQSYNGSTKTNLDLSQTDYILYWGIPGLKLLSAGILDVKWGLNLKQFDGYIELNETNAGKTRANLDFLVPMGYLAAKINPPFIPASIEASTKVISYKGSSLDDTMVKASFNLPIPVPLIDFKLDVGYKTQTLDLDDDLSDDFNGKIENKGMFAGISAKF